MADPGLVDKDGVLKIAEILQPDGLERYDASADRLLEEGHRVVTVDLGDLETINTLTIEKILLLEQELWRRGRSLRIRGCSPGVYSAFQFLKLDKFLQFEPD